MSSLVHLLLGLAFFSSASLASPNSQIREFVRRGWIFQPPSSTNPFFSSEMEHFEGTLTLGERPSFRVSKLELKHRVSSLANFINLKFFGSQATIVKNVPLFHGRNDSRVIVFQIVRDGEARFVTVFTKVEGLEVFLLSMDSSQSDQMSEAKELLPEIRKALRH